MADLSGIPVPERPADSRVSRLAELATWHEAWAASAVPVARFAPAGRRRGSDYNQHFADLGAPADLEQRFHDQADAVTSS